MITILINVFFLIPIFLLFNFIISRKRILKKIEKGNPEYNPDVLVVIPFKGIDYNIHKTIEYLKNQDYSGTYSVSLVTSDKDCDYIDSIKDSIFNCSSIKLLQIDYDPLINIRGDKVNNIINAIDTAPSSTQVFLFLDSDMIPHTSWISCMIKLLQFKEYGLVSGSAWVEDQSNSSMSLATRFWDFLATLMVCFDFTSFARGLSFGILKKTFDEINVRSVWDSATDDNFTITKLVLSKHLKIAYSPYCIISECFNLKGFEWVKWVKRQAAHTITFHKKLWAFGFFLVTLPRFLGALGFTLSVIFFFLPYTNLFTAFMAWPLIHFFTAYLITIIISNDAKNINPSHKVILKTTLASFLTTFHCMGSIMAIINRRTLWRGIIHYDNRKH